MFDIIRDSFKRYIGEVTYGSIDGLVTTFAVVSGAEGAGFGTKVIIVLGLANVIADGISMAVGCFFSVKNGKFGKGKEVPNSFCFKKSIATFVAFIILGSVPITVYAIGMPAPFIHASVFTGILFLIIGSWKGAFEKKVPTFKQAISTFFFGSAACALSYLAGNILKVISK